MQYRLNKPIDTQDWPGWEQEMDRFDGRVFNEKDLGWNDNPQNAYFYLRIDGDIGYYFNKNWFTPIIHPINRRILKGL